MVTLAFVWLSQIASACAHKMPIDHHSLALLLAIAVVSYLFGYLCGQMRFPGSPSAEGELPRKQTPEDLS